MKGEGKKRRSGKKGEIMKKGERTSRTGGGKGLKGHGKGKDGKRD